MSMKDRMINKVEQYFSAVRKRLGNHRAVVMSMAVIVVFMTTYMLVLPAITLEQNVAEKMPGMDVKTEQAAVAGESDVNGEEAEAEAGVAGGDKAEKADEADVNGEEKAEATDGEKAEANNDETAEDADEADRAGADEADAEKAADADAASNGEAADAEAGEAAEEQAESKAQLKGTVISASGKTYEVEVTYGEDAQIPEGAELKVKEILPGDKAYEGYYQKALEKVCGEDGQNNYARIFDIEIQVDGQKIEPDSEVQVSIRLSDAPDQGAGLKVVHFTKGRTELMKSEDGQKKNAEEEAEDKKDEGEAASVDFVTDAFSVYAIVSENSNNGYGLGGKKFAIVNTEVNEAVLGSTHAVSGGTRLDAAAATVKENGGTRYLIGDEVEFWEFENVNVNGNGNTYHIKASNGKYMNITGSGTATLSNTAQDITVSQSGGKLQLRASNGYALNAWNSSVADGFGGGQWGDAPERYTLFEANQVIQNQAEKISVTDLVNLSSPGTPVDKVVIYTRVENSERDGYDYYAVASDGLLLPICDIGDMVGWTSAEATSDHLEWTLTVHRNGDEHSGYFDFQSQENNLYLIPTEASGLK